MLQTLTQMTNEVRNQRMLMAAGNGMNGMNPQAQYNMMRMQQQPNGVPGDPKRAMPNRNPYVWPASSS